jgi:uncharacterized protein DUF4396
VGGLRCPQRGGERQDVLEPDIAVYVNERSVGSDSEGEAVLDKPHSAAPMSHHHHHAGLADQSLNRLAASATNHCLTGCLIREVIGMTIATALGWGDVASIALAVGLAFLFGYTLTSIPLVRAGLTIAAIVPIALAADCRLRSWK